MHFRLDRRKKVRTTLGIGVNICSAMKIAQKRITAQQQVHILEGFFNNERQKAGYLVCGCGHTFSLSKIMLKLLFLQT